MLEAAVPLVSVQLAPIDPQSAYRSPWTMHEVYAGLLVAGKSDAAGGASESKDFGAQAWADQPAFAQVSGDLQWVRFGEAGVLHKGIVAADQSKPPTELCGFTVELRRVLMQSRMNTEQFADRAPVSPAGAPVLEWKSEQGDHWETLIPARAPLAAGVRHRDTRINRSAKVRTLKKWDSGAGFEAIFNLGGVPNHHTLAPALRLTWGDEYSLVLRGAEKDADARPCIERRRTRNGRPGWQVWRKLNECESINDAFWTRQHTLRVWRLAGRIIIEFDGQSFYFPVTAGQGENERLIRANWKAAPLRLSVFGVDCLLQIAKLTGTGTGTGTGADGLPKTASFIRDAPAALQPLGFGHDFKVSGPHAVKSGSCVSKMKGDLLDRVNVKGYWQGRTVRYEVELKCTPHESPLYCALVVNFPATATEPVPDTVEVRPAITSLNVDSGDPEILPSSEATFDLDCDLLDRFCEGWQTAVLPFRPVVIRAGFAGTPPEEWTPLFRGYLLPQGLDRGGYNQATIKCVARDPRMRLNEPAGLVDERFAPLDIVLDEKRTKIWGYDAVQHLLKVELGEEVANRINGNGDPRRYFSQNHFPLLDQGGGGAMNVVQPEKNSQYHLPPPYGSYLSGWIDEIASHDHAVYFWDPTDDAFIYGRIIELYIERGLTQWPIELESAHPSYTTTHEWPLLGQLSQSGLLEKAYNDVRVWGSTNDKLYGKPSMWMGRAGGDVGPSSDPLSIAQSWRRTLLMKQDFITATAGNSYADQLAWATWQEFAGHPPERLDAAFPAGLLGPRWGELLQIEGREWRILQVKHTFSFNSEDRFSTQITARSLSGSGQ